MHNNRCKQAGSSLLILVLLFLMGGMSMTLSARTPDDGDATTPKVTPTVTLSYANTSPTVGGSVGATTLSITVSGSTTPIRSRFKYTYVIEAKQSDGTYAEVTTHTEVNGKDATVDPTTGSSVSYRYGAVAIGSKRGQFKVKVTASPTTQWATTYNEASGECEISVQPVTTTMSVSEGTKVLTSGSAEPQVTTFTVETSSNTWKAYSTTLPTVSLTASGADYTSNYSISYAFGDNDKFQRLTNKGERLDKDNNVLNDDGSIKTETVDGVTKNVKGTPALFVSTAGSEDNVTGTLTITATPTTAGAEIVGDDVKTFTVKVLARAMSLEDKKDDSKKIKTYINFKDDKHELSHYRMTVASGDQYTRTYKSLVPVITDEYGNDVTQYFYIYFGHEVEKGSTDDQHSWYQGLMTDDNIGFKLSTGKPESVFYKFSDNPFDAYYDPLNNKSLDATWKYSVAENTQEVHINNSVYRRDGNGGVTDLNKVEISTNEIQNFPDDYLIEVKAYPYDGGYNSTLYGDYSGIYAKPQVVQETVDGVTQDKVYTIKGLLYGQEKDDDDATNGNNNLNTNVYQLKSNQFIYHCMKHAPKMVFTPDPSTVQLAKGFEMNTENRFHVEGYFKDETLDSQPEDSLLYDKSEFTYSVFVPDDNLYNAKTAETEGSEYPKDGNVKVKLVSKYYQSWDNTWVEDAWPENYVDAGAYQYVEVKNSDGTTSLKRMHGTRYLTKRNHGDDHLFMTFYGEGNVSLNYAIMPSNHQTWDAGSQQTVTYTVAKAEPTYMVIVPTEIVTTTGVTSSVPEVRVYTQGFNEDVTEYFNLTPSKTTSTDNFTLGTGVNASTDAKDVKYAVTSDVAGVYNVTVDATKTDANTRYSEPESKTYDVIVKTASGTALYEVIYDENEFGSNGLDDKMESGNRVKNASKMGKLHFIGSGKLTPGTASVREMPGITVRFGTAAEAKNGYNGYEEGYSYGVSSMDDDYSADNTKYYDNGKDVVNDGKTAVARHYLLLDGTNIPDGKDTPDAGYIELSPLTNGFLTIDARYTALTDAKTTSDLWIIRDMSTGDEQEITATLNSDGTYSSGCGEKSFGLPLLAGHTYALWNDQMSGYIHGLTFEPAFIALATDHDGWHTATTFRNGYTGSLPKLRSGSNSTISYKLRDVATSTTDAGKLSDLTSGYHASINAETGLVTALRLTSDKSLTVSTLDTDDKTKFAEMANRVVVIASVKGETKSDGKVVEKRPHYNLYIGNMPTYIVEDGANFDQGYRISTTNIPTRIWMTLGGWEHVNDATYPYGKTDTKTGQDLIDGWRTAKMDSVGRDQMTIDDFNYGSFGEQNAIDEDLNSWNGSRQAKPWNVASVTTAEGASTATLDDQINTFCVPVRGTYLKFEPEESGRLFLYVLQNGMTDVSKGDNQKKWTKSDAKYLRRRALYIVDEAGQNVNIPSGSEEGESWSNVDAYLATGGKTVTTRFSGYTIPNNNYYCDGITRVGWGTEDTDDWEKASKAGMKAFEISTDPNGKHNSWMSSYDHTGNNTTGMTLTAKGQAAMDADIKLVTDWWKNDADTYKADGKRTADFRRSKLDGPDEVLKLSDGGFVLPTKGYVRYTFEVKAGKTYYVFMTGSKLGFCGFGFLPQGYTSDATPWLNSTTGIAVTNQKRIDGGAFTKAVYDNLPEPDGSYKEGSTAKTSSTLYNGTAFGGSDITLDASLQSTADLSYEKQKATIISSGSDHQFVNVNLKRTFRNKRWAGICLPFSVSETQVKKVFGSNASVITFDSVRWGRKANDTEQYRTVHFTRHVVQNIEAGRPYFVYPDSAGVDEGTAFKLSDGSTNGLRFEHVTFEGVEPKEIVGYNETAYTGNKDIFTYKSAGIYDCARVPYYSYYMKLGSTAQSYLSRFTTSKESNVTDQTKWPLLMGYNTYLYPYSDDAQGSELVKTGEVNSAKMAQFWIKGSEMNGGEVTAIDELVEDINVQQTLFVDGVYTIDGKQVRATNSLDGLAPGVYIMGGKKYTVK